MTLVNGVAYSTNNGGIMQTDGTNDYIVLSPFNQVTTNHTIMAAVRYSGATRGRIITSFSNNWLLGHWNNQNPVYYAEGWMVGPGVASNTNWQITTGVENYSSDVWSMYINGSLSVSNGNGSQGPNGLCLGAWLGSGEYSTAEISFLMFYNRLLTADEIKQNYNAIKKRFGY